MFARALSKVLSSTSDKFTEGDTVLAQSGWSEYSVVDASGVQKTQEIPGVGMTQYLGALGTTGLTAWFGLTEVAKATEEDAVVVSGAAGATGSMVVQIAKHILGCKKVIGIAGGAEKCKWVESLGADICVDYKAPSFKKDLRSATEGFVEVYFDNVGGEILDLMLTRMAKFGRVAACGAVAEYNKSETYGLKNWYEVISMRVQIRGFIVMDYLSRAGEALGKMGAGVKEGKIRVDGSNETVVETGFEGVPETWMKLFEGGNRGKLITALK